MSAQELLKALRLSDSNDNKSALVALVLGNKSWDAVETMESMPRAKRESMWKLAAGRVDDIVERELHRQEEDEEGQVSPEHVGAIDVLSAICSLASSFLECESSDTECVLLFHAMHSLHNVLFELSSACGVKLQLHVVSFCVVYWKRELPRRHELMPLSVIWLLFKTLSESVRQEDIRSVYAVRDALNLFDFEDASSETLQQLLLRCSISPKFVQYADGRKFLAFLMGATAFGVNAHACIKHQLPNAAEPIARQYGDVYFRAWQLSEGQYRLAVEAHMLQDLMYSAAHASVPEVSSAVKSVFKAIFKHKAQKEVDSMLTRLYAPILWRALEAPNAQVRFNALLMLGQAFPLRDAEMTPAANEELLDQQYDALSALAGDNDVRVRALAVETMCKVLGSFLELVPMRVTKSMLHILVKDLALDASAASVRVAVCRGLAFVLKNKLSHPLLKITLPSLSPLLFDRSMAVCKEFCSLLLAVKNIKAIRFFDVVSIDDVVRKLSMCSNQSVSKKLSELLLNSYFPSSDSKRTKPLKRMLRFFRTDSEAAVHFCAQLPHLVPEHSLAKFVVSLYRCLCRSASIEDSKGDTEVDVSDSGMVETILRVMGTLWEAVASAEEEESDTEGDAADGAEGLVQYMSTAMSDGGIDKLFALPQLSPAARVAILQLSAKLSSEATPLLCDLLLQQVAEFPADVEATQFRPVLECLFAWHKENSVLDLMEESFSALVEEDGTAPTLSHTLALRYLKYLLSSEQTNARLVASSNLGWELSCTRLRECCWQELQSELTHAASEFDALGSAHNNAAPSRNGAPIGALSVTMLLDVFRLLNDLHTRQQLHASAEDASSPADCSVEPSVEFMAAVEFISDSGMPMWIHNALAAHEDGKGQGSKRRKIQGERGTSTVVRLVASVLALMADTAAVSVLDTRLTRAVFSWLECMRVPIRLQRGQRGAEVDDIIEHSVLMMNKIVMASVFALGLQHPILLPEFGGALQDLLEVTSFLWTPIAGAAIQRTLDQLHKRITNKRQVQLCVVSAYLRAAFRIVQRSGTVEQADNSSSDGEEEGDARYTIHSSLVKFLMRSMRESSQLCKSLKSALGAALADQIAREPEFQSSVSKVLFHMLPSDKYRDSRGGKKLIALISDCVDMVVRESPQSASSSSSSAISDSLGKPSDNGCDSDNGHMQRLATLVGTLQQ